MSPKEGGISAGSHGTATRVLIPSNTYYRRTLPSLTPQHKVITAISSFTTEGNPASFPDDRDEDDRTAVKALGDIQNNSPQLSASNPIHVYCPPPSSS